MGGVSDLNTRHTYHHDVGIQYPKESSGGIVGQARGKPGICHDGPQVQ